MKQGILGYYILLLLLSLPLLTLIYLSLIRKQSNLTQRIISTCFLSAIITHPFPKWCCALLSTILLIIFGLIVQCFHEQQQQLQQPQLKEKTYSPKNPIQDNSKRKAVQAAFCLIITLLIENFCVWVVSATYTPSHTSTPTPLQDNGKNILQYLLFRKLEITRDEIQWIRNVLKIPWALVTSFAGCLICSELQLGTSAYTSLSHLSHHSLQTLTIARIIRTISFTLTVLPSQIHLCYQKHNFPIPPPSNWIPWIHIGFLPSARGGCNDLILSGHATVTTVLTCAITTIVGWRWFTVCIWTLLVFDFCVEIVQGLHYSVDMWLGSVVTCLIWFLLQQKEQQQQPSNNYHNPATNNTNTTITSLSQNLLQHTTIYQFIIYTIPSIMAFVITTLFSNSIANYWLVLYFMVSAGIVVRNQYSITPFAQHILICALFIGFGIYL